MNVALYWFYRYWSDPTWRRCVTPIDECHLPRTICHQDPGRCAEGMNGLVNAGRRGGNNDRNSLRCQLSLGTGDTYRWETATDAQVTHIPGDIYCWGSQPSSFASAVMESWFRW